MVRERPVKRSKNRRENQAAQQDMAQRRLKYDIEAGGEMRRKRRYMRESEEER